MTPQNELATVVLIWMVIGAVILIINSVYLWEKRKEDQKVRDRKHHLMNQAAIRIREFTLLYEELWRKMKP